MENNRAWHILKEEEQSSLSLSIGFGKSSWEAGEIMNKAHYKYLEIKQRAEAFMKLFTSYFEETETFIPENSNLDWDFREYLECVIEKRLSVNETVQKNNNSLLYTELSRERLIREQMVILENHEDKLHQNLFHLIKEFDRWNNFRILPKDLQEPSAFKRRNKARNLKHLNHICKIPEFSINLLIKKYKYSGKYSKSYLTLISSIFDDNYLVIPIKKDNKILEELTKLGLFVFNDNDEANEFGYLVENYMGKEKKTCKEGQIFWPEYRILSSKALNWDGINNIIPSRKNLSKAYRDMDLIKVNKRKMKKVKSSGEKRSKESSMW